MHVTDSMVKAGKAVIVADEMFDIELEKLMLSLDELEPGDFWQMQHTLTEDLFVNKQSPFDAASEMFNRLEMDPPDWNGNCSYEPEDAYRFVATYINMTCSLFICLKELELNKEIAFWLPLTSRTIHDQFTAGALDPHDLYQSMNELSEMRYAHKGPAEFIRSHDNAKMVLQRLIENVGNRIITTNCQGSRRSTARFDVATSTGKPGMGKSAPEDDDTENNGGRNSDQRKRDQFGF